MNIEQTESPERIWTCKIGGPAPRFPQGADAPMRNAVRDAFALLTGADPDFIFSGWGGELTEPERAVVENRLPREVARDAQWQAALAEQEPVAHSVLQIGNHGAAYDSPGTRRAFTYTDQPGNVPAWRLGEAVCVAAKASAGDPIDRGLSLLKALQDKGFGVFEIDPAPTNPAPQERAEPVAPAVGERAKALWETIKILGFQNEKFALQHIEAALSATPPAPAQPATEPSKPDQAEAPCAVCGGIDWLPGCFTDYLPTLCMTCLGNNQKQTVKAEVPIPLWERVVEEFAGLLQQVEVFCSKHGEADFEISNALKVIGEAVEFEGQREATFPPASAAGERERFEAEFPIPDGMVYWDGDKYGVLPDYENSYRADRYCGQWRAWQARAALPATPPAPAQPAINTPEHHAQILDAVRNGRMTFAPGWNAQPSPEPSKPEQAEAPKFPLSAWGTLAYAKSALNAILTHMGMDEDEWNKPTFEQARSAVRALEYQLEKPDQVAVWKTRYESIKGPLSEFHKQSVAAGFDGISDALATLPPASAAGERDDLSQWEKARFGYFDQAGRFVEFSGEDNELPNDSSPRWVGGRHDMQLLRAALATSPQAEQPATPPAQTVQDKKGGV